MPFNGGGFSGGGFGQAPAAPVTMLGAPTQAAGVKDYNGVWASYQCPSCDAAIRDMQAMINRAAVAMTVPGVAVTIDGKVGAGTVSGLRNVIQAGIGRGYGFLGALVPYQTAEAVAKAADTISSVLRQIPAGSSGAPVSTPPVSTTPTPVYTPPAGGAMPPIPGFPDGGVSTQPSAFKKAAPWLIGGGILLVGIAAAGFILTRE
jgi:hypothetical protein